MSLTQYPGYFVNFYVWNFFKSETWKRKSMENEVNADDFNNRVLNLLENPKLRVQKLFFVRISWFISRVADWQYMYFWIIKRRKIRWTREIDQMMDSKWQSYRQRNSHRLRVSVILFFWIPMTDIFEASIILLFLTDLKTIKISYRQKTFLPWPFLFDFLRTP